MVAGILALGINYGAYMTEIFRAGIQSVGIGQREAALAIGMTQRQLMQRIVLPQAIRLVIPPIGNQFIAMLKDTALVSVTGFVWEILWRAQKQGRAYFRNLEALFIAAIFYWILTIIFSLIQGRVEAYLAKGDR
jgi:polar amino acid transport system permease protein